MSIIQTDTILYHTNGKVAVNLDSMTMFVGDKAYQITRIGDSYEIDAPGHDTWDDELYRSVVGMLHDAGMCDDVVVRALLLIGVLPPPPTQMYGHGEPGIWDEIVSGLKFVFSNSWYWLFFAICVVALVLL